MSDYTVWCEVVDCKYRDNKEHLCNIDSLSIEISNIGFCKQYEPSDNIPTKDREVVRKMKGKPPILSPMERLKENKEYFECQKPQKTDYYSFKHGELYGISESIRWFYERLVDCRQRLDDCIESCEMNPEISDYVFSDLFDELKISEGLGE